MSIDQCSSDNKQSVGVQADPSNNSTLTSISDFADDTVSFGCTELEQSNHSDPVDTDNGEVLECQVLTEEQEKLQDTVVLQLVEPLSDQDVQRSVKNELGNSEAEECIKILLLTNLQNNIQPTILLQFSLMGS